MNKATPTHLLVSTAFLAATLAAGSAFAHDGNDHTISSQGLKMSWSASSPKRNKFTYKTKEQIEINDSSVLAVDPSTVTSSLVVRGSGVGDGDTGVIVLDPAGWSALGNKGWKYKADTRFVASGGVKQIKIKTNPAKGGQLQVKAKGAFWDYAIFQAQSTIEMSLAIGDAIFCAQYGADPSELQKNEGTASDGKVSGKASGVISGGECPSACGNGILELGEECDDGNGVDDDTCNNSCEGCEAGDIEFTSTFDGIQALVFDNPTFGCTNAVCHGAGMAGGLDLTAGNSYDALVNVASPNWAGNPFLVQPGDEEFSLLYSKLAHATLGAPTIPNTGGLMPAGGNPALTTELLSAIDLWIRGGAPEDTVVEGTAELLGACLPAASPQKIPQPPAPDPGTGVQFTLPSWPLSAQSEDEICVPFYYDISDLAVTPAQYRVPCPGQFPDNDTDECVAYKTTYVAQDPQSHHVIMRMYEGSATWDDEGWGTWTCHQGPNDGLGCDPTVANACPDGQCAGDTKSGVACLSLGDPFGPDDFGFLGATAPQFFAAQEATRFVDFPDESYLLLPLKGVMVWNSHAFNLTNEDMDLEGWLNIEFQDMQTYEVAELFDDTYIFTQDVPAFEQREYCATHTFDQGTNLFQLTSHTHRHGTRFRIYAPPQTPCPSGGNSGFSDITDPNCLPGDPGDIMYESFEYADPLELRWVDSPLVYDSADPEDRTLKFCALYDNGFTDPTSVKRRSVSPPPPNPFTPGGPCELTEVKCLVGINQGQLCNGDDGLCPNGVCDACDLTGGVRTEDEMFILMGYYFID